MDPRRLRPGNRLGGPLDICLVGTSEPGHHGTLHSLGDEADRLDALLGQLGSAFMRCHRRAAVRLSAIDRIEPLDKGDCELVLRSGARVEDALVALGHEVTATRWRGAGPSDEGGCSPCASGSGVDGAAAAVAEAVVEAAAAGAVAADGSSRATRASASVS